MNSTLYWVGLDLLVMTSIKCCLFYPPLNLSIRRSMRAQRKETYLQLYTNSLKLSLKNEKTSGIWKNWTEGKQTVLVWPHTKRASAGGGNRSWNILRRRCSWYFCLVDHSSRAAFIHQRQRTGQTCLLSVHYEKKTWRKRVTTVFPTFTWQ